MYLPVQDQLGSSSIGRKSKKYHHQYSIERRVPVRRRSRMVNQSNTLRLADRKPRAMGLLQGGGICNAHMLLIEI